MAHKIVLTGATGFIGRHVLGDLLKNGNNHVYAIVRSNRIPAEFAESEQVTLLFADLSNGVELTKTVDSLQFDTVLHIGAIRGSQRLDREAYDAVNIESTRILAQNSLEKGAKFIFCSSVGVFGAIPKELPPNDKTERQSDNYYHHTKILAESVVKELCQSGLRGVIIRPSITYGVGDFGFPCTLIRLAEKGIFLNCLPPVKISLTDVRLLSQAFINAAKIDTPSEMAYEVCDLEPVQLSELVDFIYQQMTGRLYPKYKALPRSIFHFFRWIAERLFHSELWKMRCELISNSWYYDPSPAMRDLHISPRHTLPNFKYVIDWYKSIDGKGGK